MKRAVPASEVSAAAKRRGTSEAGALRAKGGSGGARGPSQPVNASARRRSPRDEASRAGERSVRGSEAPRNERGRSPASEGGFGGSARAIAAGELFVPKTLPPR